MQRHKEQAHFWLGEFLSRIYIIKSIIWFKGNFDIGPDINTHFVWEKLPLLKAFKVDGLKWSLFLTSATLLGYEAHYQYEMVSKPKMSFDTVVVMSEPQFDEELLNL